MKKLCATLLCLALCMGVLPVRAAGPEVNAARGAAFFFI